MEGKQVRLEKDISETDRYGRLLRYVYQGELFINEVLVLHGFAHASSFPPDVKYQEALNAAQSQAKLGNKGLWMACSSPTPIATPATLGASQTTTTQTNTTSHTSGTCDIKGNISSKGEKIYHIPGQNFYDRTVIDESKGEKWFCSASEAESAGWRVSLK